MMVEKLAMHTLGENGMIIRDKTGHAMLLSENKRHGLGRFSPLCFIYFYSPQCFVRTYLFIDLLNDASYI